MNTQHPDIVLMMAQLLGAVRRQGEVPLPPLAATGGSVSIEVLTASGMRANYLGRFSSEVPAGVQSFETKLQAAAPAAIPFGGWPPIGAYANPNRGIDQAYGAAPPPNGPGTLPVGDMILAQRRDIRHALLQVFTDTDDDSEFGINDHVLAIRMLNCLQTSAFLRPADLFQAFEVFAAAPYNILIKEKTADGICYRRGPNWAELTSGQRTLLHPFVSPGTPGTAVPSVEKTSESVTTEIEDLSKPALSMLDDRSIKEALANALGESMTMNGVRLAVRILEQLGPQCPHRITPDALLVMFSLMIHASRGILVAVNYAPTPGDNGRHYRRGPNFAQWMGERRSELSTYMPSSKD